GVFYAMALVEKAKKKPKRVLSGGVVEAPKAQTYYRIEYNMLPGDQDPVKVDLVMFGLAAKIYMENETKVLKPWLEGDQVWLGWSQSVKVRVTRELLIKLVSHKITFKIWDTKDRVSAKARYCTTHTDYRLRPGIAELNPQVCQSCPFLNVCMLGDRCLTDCLETCSSGVYEGLCNITLDRPLISEKLKAELNPLVITILSASSLPSSPVPFHVLEEKCLPVYCQYQFHNTSMHRTKGQEHSTKVYFNDVNVIMTGGALPGELLEVLRGPPLEIEVHDRDRKLEKVSTNPALFGTYPNDDKLSSVVLVSGKRTNHHPFTENNKRYDPCGLAKLNLNDLLQGQRSLEVNLPIRCSPPPQLLSSERSDWERKMASMPATGGVDGPEQQPGHYFDANSQLKVQVEIACPLKVGGGASDGTWDCPFGRIIYLFKYANVSVMSRLRAELLRINAVAFHLEDQSEETVERALSCYKMAVRERESRDMDMVTGFHLLDKQIHLFVLEGLKHKGVRRLWETFSIQLTGSEEDQVMVLYNSGLSFSKRLYTLLDVSFTPVHLHQPLETIMRQPLVYVRDMVPHTCFQAMSRYQICLSVCYLHLSLCVSVCVFDLQPICLSVCVFDLQPMVVCSALTLIQPIHTYSQANIAEVQQASLQLQRARPAVLLAPLDDKRHSIQTTTWTYNQQYHSAAVDPQEVEAERKARENQRRAAWRTHDGFLYPGFRSSIERRAQEGDIIDSPGVRGKRSGYSRVIFIKAHSQPRFQQASPSPVCSATENKTSYSINQSNVCI
uniref:KIAA1257 ortholog n=1 Tax=Salmo trutta TaxID=8032 RepID=A0A674C7E5_SALTR